MELMFETSPITFDGKLALKKHAAAFMSFSVCRTLSMAKRHRLQFHGSRSAGSPQLMLRTKCEANRCMLCFTASWSSKTIWLGVMATPDSNAQRYPAWEAPDAKTFRRMVMGSRCSKSTSTLDMSFPLGIFCER